MATYSHSKLTTYEQCPLKYKFRYIDHIKSDKKTIEAFLGTCVHKSLEKLYADLQLWKLDSLEELLASYEQLWEKEYTPEIEVLRADMNPQNYFETGKRMLRGYYGRFHPFDQQITVDLELPVSFPLAEGTVFTGYVDRVAKNGDRSYEIHDYKTSRHLPSQAEIEQDRQLPLYELAIRHRWPDAKEVRLIWHYLAFETELETTKTPAVLQTLKERTLQRVREIEGAEQFPPHETALCDWCEYFNICPAKQHEVRVAELPPPEFQLETGVNLVDRYVALKETAKTVKKQFDEEMEQLEEAIIAYAEKNGVTTVVGSQTKVCIQEKEILRLPARGTDPAAHAAVVDLLRRAGLWEKVATLDGRAVVSALEAGELPESLVRELEAFLIKETKKRLYVSKRQKEEP